MNSNKNRIFAVLTGDIVGSTRLANLDRQHLHEALTSSSQKLVDIFTEYVPYQPEIFRGDSWQLVVNSPSKSLRIGLFFRALIKASMKEKRIDTRVSIGFGSIDFMPGNRISSGDGEAYRHSGEGLENIHKPNRMVIVFPSRYRSEITQALDIIVKLIDLQARNWTKKQANAVSGALLDLTQETIAKNWFIKDVSQQAVAQHLDRAGWSTIEPGIAFYERLLPDIIHERT